MQGMSVVRAIIAPEPTGASPSNSFMPAQIPQSKQARILALVPALNCDQPASKWVGRYGALLPLFRLVGALCIAAFWRVKSLLRQRSDRPKLADRSLNLEIHWRYFPADAKTLREPFRVEHDRGVAVADAAVANALHHNAANSNNVAAQIWYHSQSPQGSSM